MPLEPMTNTCPSCGTPMLPKLVRRDEPESGPLSAEVPVVLVCPHCSSPEDDRR